MHSRVGFLASVLLATSVFGHEGFCKSWKWVTVDDYVVPNMSASASAVHVQRGVAYVAGVTDDTMTQHWVVRKTSNSGQTWSVVDDYIHSIGLRNHPEAIVRDTVGNVFIAGGANNLSMAGPWLIRKSANQGASWATVDTFEDPAGGAGSARGLTVDGQGHVLVVGESAVAGDGYHWFVRGTADQGQTWTTRDEQPGVHTGMSATAVATTASGDVFAGGWIWDNGTYYRCLVRRQLAGTNTWTTVDDHQQVFGGYCWVRNVVAAKGKIFVSMQALDAAGTGHWIVRRSADNGATWSTVDDVVMDGHCNPRGMAFDRKLELFVTGKCLVGNSYKWVTRRTHDLGATWSTEDVFQLVGGQTTYASGIDTDGPDHVFAVGFGNDGTRNHWLVRKRVCAKNHETDEQLRRGVLLLKP